MYLASKWRIKAKIIVHIRRLGMGFGYPKSLKTEKVVNELGMMPMSYSVHVAEASSYDGSLGSLRIRILCFQ